MGGAITQEMRSHYCDNQKNILYQYNSEYWSEYIDIVITISGFITMTCALMITRHKHLQKSPAPLIAALCYCESYASFMGVSRTLYCNDNVYLGWERMSAATIFFDTSDASQYRVMDLMA